ncbi:PA0069 family radical SAM protein [Halomonas sp. McH1-25]|uniref:PA0069 family radical SAM protein n=1 Tax=unclassified Halomonas TaxID=2609666 RepID=UPI001EF57E60|nr:MULTISPECIES: PA0069 family radical SAM protein [unclassified Halomonas]MCG7601970.1 PA0069 family radical SAM protein [Halomonas sp. McH1-25]MCP1341589.1 PA0069 family radical SAM protein [Halomonas sp. FL8]MCP1360235.1 PA0069 family radical SAM protein [Halomonas sp. BBD45]MCP1364629.1 PA0069 family radical SAM protein [Halomonas sp. BBD48]
MRHPSHKRKGRGATFDPHNRFAPTSSEAEDDGWWQEAAIERLATTVRDERSKSALSWNDSPDLGFDRSLNPYRGCEHGCVYCFARPSHAYWDLSPGIDFETQLIARTGLVETLREELCKPGYVCRPINMSGNTDCYQPLEAERRTTRALLELLLECRHPVTLVTKSALILRDLDLLAALARQRLVRVFISLTTLDDDLKRTLEPRTASPAARLKTLRSLNRAGIPVGALIAPLIPGLNDHELERLLQAAKDAGAGTAAWALLRLPHEVAPLFEDWLNTHYPERAGKVMSLIRQCRGGSNYDARFGQRMRGQGVFADMLRQRFDSACRRLDLGHHAAMGLDCHAFRPPNRQADLFD